MKNARTGVRQVVALFSTTLLVSIVAVSRPCFAGTNTPPYELSPVLLTGDSLKDFTAGLDFKLAHDFRSVTNLKLGTWSGHVSANTEGELLFDADQSRKPIVTEIEAGFTFDLATAQEIEIPAEEDRNKPIGPGVKDDAKLNDYGTVAAKFVLRHEADQKLHQQDIVGGAELSYINIQDKGIWSFVPSVIVAFDLVRSIDEPHSRHADGDADKDHARLRIEASLKSSFGKLLFDEGSFWEPLGLRLDVRHHELSGADNTLDDSATYAAAALTYKITENRGLWRHTTLFVRLSDGRIPPAEEDETVLTIGATNPW